MKRLTRNQLKMYNYLENYILKYGYAPTIAEMKEELRVKYVNSITQWLKALEKHGLIARNLNQHRGVYLTKNTGKDYFSTIIPVLSSVGCDNLQVLADNNYSDFITIDNFFIKKIKSQVVAFKAAGSSMTEAGIENGDYAITEITNDINSGDLVVANVGDMAVAKRVRFTSGAVVLSPESKNKKYHPIIMKDNSRIFGKIVDIVRMSPKEDELRYEPLEENNF